MNLVLAAHQLTERKLVPFHLLELLLLLLLLLLLFTAFYAFRIDISQAINPIYVLRIAH
jgi:hypothetical protein